MGIRQPSRGGRRRGASAAARPIAALALVASISLLPASALASFSLPAFSQDGEPPASTSDYAAKERLLFVDPANRDLVASDLVKDDAAAARVVVERGLLPGGNEDVVLALVKAIAYHRDSDHLEALLLLHGTDPREKVRAAVKEALDPMVTPAVELRLFELLRSPNQPLSVQKSAIQFMGRTFDRRIVDGLVDLLSESGTLFDSAPGKNLIGDALGRMTPADFGASAEEWRRWWTAERSRSDADILLSALRQERERANRHRREAVSARKSLIDFLRQRKGEEAAFLAEILAVLRVGEYPEVQQHALLRLKELYQGLKGRADAPADVRFGPAIDVVMSLLAQPGLDRAVQIGAIDVLATLAEPDSRAGDDARATGERAARAIAAFLPVGQPEEVTLAAVKALGRLRNAFAAGPLLLRLTGVASGGSEGELPTNGHGPAGAAPNGLREEIVLALGEIGAPSASATLVKLLLAREGEPAGVRASAASALGRLGTEGASTALADALANDPDPKVRWRSADSLARLGGAGVESALVAGLSDGAKEVRKQCAAGLAAMKSVAAIQPLALLLKDPDDVVREAAVSALGAIGDPAAVRAIVEIIEDPSDKVAFAAQKAFVAVLGGSASLLLDETRALAAEGKEKLALDLLRLARESIDVAPAGTWREDAILEIDRAYLDALVASGTEESIQAAIRLAGRIAEEAEPTETATRTEFRRKQGDLFLAAKDYENAIETFSRLLSLDGVTGDATYEIHLRLGRACLEHGRVNADMGAIATAGRHLSVDFPERVSSALREERARLLVEIRDEFVRQVNVLFEDGIGSAASLSTKWQEFEKQTSKLSFVESLLDSVRDAADPAYVKNVARALRAVAPDAPPLTEGATPAEREKEIEALRKFWQRRLPPSPDPDRR